ncbi:MAG: hypothetical protein COZ57_20425 [Armatimonadetes bacterium CG_4_8_14_3_um_filter_66_20]|nr:MAG: hypothetical protein COZ57_20425 [Armatimonadetes bacterium CG_4_8_14_3_um_filter_66_20]
MPFTLAHPAAVLPVRKALRGWAVLPALVVGSRSPDFAYFLPVPLNTTPTHSLAALLWCCLPTGVVAFFLFDWVLKRPLASLLPRAVRCRLPAERLAPARFSLARLPRVGLCVILGAVTHLLWDSFTHEGGFFVVRVATLQTVIVDAAGYTMRTHRVLQHCSTVFGLALLAAAAWRWCRTTPARADRRAEPLPSCLRPWTVAAVLLAGCCGACLPRPPAQQVGGWLGRAQAAANPAVIASGQAILCALAVYVAVWWVAAWRARR